MRRAGETSFDEFDSAFLQGNELNGLPGNANVKVRVIEELGKA